MTTAQLKEYNGVVFLPERATEVIKAKSLDAAKAQMKKRHGAEKEGTTTRWVCGLAPQSLTGHPAK